MQDATDQPLYIALRKARQAANLRQSELARKIGCTQSALSMFEGGKPGAIAKETVAKLAEALGIALPDEPGLVREPAPVSLVRESNLVYCPNFQCLSNFPYSIGGQILFMPTGSAGCGPHCALCGEITESACPACGARMVSRGGCCGACGAALVAWPEAFADDPAAWILSQRAAISALAAALPLR